MFEGDTISLIAINESEVGAVSSSPVANWEKCDTDISFSSHSFSSLFLPDQWPL
ncbi:unnamed protein product [Brugia timori]|uniref:Uncharacterized protein n=1 Tax=Brugia timori TaxID=42155 RepID=A0A0R3R4X5_9BILA|nr:unnamed protein product [Brugia timori]